MSKLAVLALMIAAACLGDSIVNVDRGDSGRSFDLHVGQLLDVKVWNCIPGYDPPSISSDAVEYRGEDLDGFPTPGCHSEKHHFVGKHSGVADIVFRRLWRTDSAGVRREQLIDTLAYRIEVQ
jgi:hypothetical protein